MAGGVMRALLEAGTALYAAGWEARRRAYASGLAAPRAVGSRVVSVGNLTVGGTGKTTLTLHLARIAVERGADVAVICRRYRPGPAGEGDEERLYSATLGADRVYAGRSKGRLAERAAAAGRQLLLVDDGFSHWSLERDLDVVLLDSTDPWGGGRLLPLGRLREPRRALQRAEVIVISRLDESRDPEPLLREAGRLAPAAYIAAGRHRIVGLRGLDGAPRRASGAASVVTATGNPWAVERSAREAGFERTELRRFRDHHWFTAREARAEIERARRSNSTVLLTAKDAVRWPEAGRDDRVTVLEVGWEWIAGGRRVERLVLDQEERT